MNVLPVGIALCLVSVHAFAAGNSSLYTSLTDLNQNPAFRPKLLAAPASSFKLAKVHFVVDTADKIVSMTSNSLLTITMRSAAKI